MIVSPRAPRRAGVRRVLVRLLAINALAVGGLVAVGVSLTSRPTDLVVVTGEADVAGVGPEPSAWLLAHYECWSGEAPADMRGAIPEHVVVRSPGGGAEGTRGAWAYAGGGELVLALATRGGISASELPSPVDWAGLALAQTFGDQDHGLEIAGFCR
ncbi:MAG: hypothetical protein QM572_04605 [Nocardioides sp.]|uniref:hypothetical protein n=1 Tax=Nocardioides sp. TaxID=35761 RepID=UPI0039E708A3